MPHALEVGPRLRGDDEAGGGPRGGWCREGGGEVPVLASSLHMLVDGRNVVVRLEAQLWNAAICASGSFLVSHLRRADRSIRGSCPCLPEAKGALGPQARRRCTWFRQFRDAVDTVPSFPEPSGIYVILL